MHTSIKFSASLLALASAWIAAPAFAEEAPAAPVESAVEGDASRLTEIVVTATKRETNLQKTPIAISVLAPEAIKDRHVQSLIDMADGVVPSLRVATFEARQSALVVGIRGIVPFDQNQTARDGGVGVYVDGIYLGRSQGLNAALLDVQRLEVLRGPQGTLFGRNTEGGALSIVTKAPTGEFGGRVTAGVGNYGAYNGEVHIDFPAIYNIAFKLDGVIQHQGATVSNPLSGQFGWNYKNSKGGRVSALWKPVDGLSIDVAYDRGRDENTPFYSQLVSYNPNKYNVGSFVGSTLTYNNTACNVVVNKVTTNPCIRPLSSIVTVGGTRQSAAEIGVPQQPSTDDTDGTSITAKYKVSPDLELRSITGWRGVTTWQWDNSGGAHRSTFGPNATFSRYSLSYLRQRQFSQELQAVGHLTDIDYAVGLYYFTENVREYAATPQTNTWNATGTAYTINNALNWDPANWSRQRDSNATAHSYAAFAQATWTPIDPLHITVGGRYTKDKRRGALTFVQGKVANFPFTFSNGRFDPMVTLAVDAADGVNLYAKYSTGYRAGGANSRSSTFTAFNPESVKAYEVGAKLDLLDRKLRLNLAAYAMDRTGTQIDFDNVDTVIGSPTLGLHTEETRNAPGVSKIRGLEAELTARPVENLTMGLSYAYTDAKIPLTPNPFFANAPTQVFVVFTPKNAASGYVDYDLPLGGAGARLRFHVDANYASSAYSFQNQATKVDGSFVVNGRLALVDIPMGSGSNLVTISAWGRNLFNEQHIYRRDASNSSPTLSADGSLSYSGILGDYANFNAPRTFGIDATVHF
ncbi:TonB-dependent receptor [Novosphingobium bradum]|uniref:TonB-dependent receptor n=1 Tax=Novosphingobium bradum TaxID=1737444 RepID=A0ABV7IRJ6_9SPHN